MLGRHKFVREAGLTLIEVVVAVLLLAVASLAAATLQQSGTRINQRSLNREIAASLARQLLENVDAMYYNTSSGTYNGCLTTTANQNTYATPCAAVSPANPLNALGQNQAGAPYTRDWSITDNGGGTTGAKTNENRKTIRVRVQWNERGAQQILVSTIKAWTVPVP